MKLAAKTIHMQEIFSSSADEHRFSFRLLKIIRYCIDINDKKVFEAGCGDGRHLLDLAQAPFSLLVGGEYSIKLLERAWFGYLSKARERQSQSFIALLNYVCLDAVDLPFKDGSFDVVFSNSFFEHVYDPLDAFLEQMRILKSNGILIISVGNLLNPKTFFDLFFKYAAKSRFKRGGIKWLLKKKRVTEDPYGKTSGYKTIKQRDEDVKGYFWWKLFLRKHLPANAKLIDFYTSRLYSLPRILKPILKPFWGGIRILIRKT